MNFLSITKEITLKHLNKDKYCVFLFGSRASGDSSISSDIDIGIIGTERIGDLYYKIINEIEESAVPYQVEIVDFNTVEEDFKRIVLEGDIIIWNMPKYFDQNLLSIKKL